MLKIRQNFIHAVSGATKGSTTGCTSRENKMGKTPGFRAIFRGLLVLVTGAVLYASSAQAAVVPSEDPQVQTQYNNDNNINTICDNSVYNEQYNGVHQHAKAVQLAVLDDTRDQPMVDQAKRINDMLGNAYFCPIKITSLNSIMAALSSIAGGIMAAVIAAAQALIVNLINTVLQAICSAIINAINWVASLICIPNITLNLRLPNFSFPTGPVANNCSGMKLFSVTGGPPLVNPPLSYGATIPGTSWQGRVNVIR